MILNTNVHSEAAIRLKYALGVDAFLLEPYSSEQLKEVVEFSFQTQQERAEIRQQIALSLVIIDVIDQVNLIAFLQSHGFSTTQSMKRLVELCRPLQQASEHVLKIYFSLLEKLFPAAPFPSHFSSEAYHRGITNRVREKMERRIIRDLQEMRITGSSPLKELKDLVLAEQSHTKVRVISK